MTQSGQDIKPDLFSSTELYSEYPCQASEASDQIRGAVTETGQQRPDLVGNNLVRLLAHGVACLVGCLGAGEAATRQREEILGEEGELGVANVVTQHRQQPRLPKLVVLTNKHYSLQQRDDKFVSSTINRKAEPEPCPFTKV